MKKIKYKAFEEYLLSYNHAEFQDFCNRYQRLFYTNYRATIARPGDLANDGIMTPYIRGAYYALERDTANKGSSVATKIEKDFRNMVQKHPQLECMIFMTRTKGLYPQVQTKLDKLRSEEYQQDLLKSLFPDQEMKQKSLIKIKYLGMEDMFDELRPFKKEETWEYLLNHCFWIEPAIELPKKFFDDPSFMAQWISSGVKLFDNVETPHLLIKREALVPLENCLYEKMKRDKRKFGVKKYEDIPYQPWEILQTTPQHFDPIFDVPVHYIADDDTILRVTLTPLILSIILKIMIIIFEDYCTYKNQQQPLLFTDLLVRALFIQKENKGSFTLDEQEEMELWSETVLRFLSDPFTPVLIQNKSDSYTRNKDGYIEIKLIDKN